MASKHPSSCVDFCGCFRLGIAAGHMEVRQVAQEQAHDWRRCRCDSCITISVVLSAYHHPQAAIPKEAYR